MWDVGSGVPLGLGEAAATDTRKKQELLPTPPPSISLSPTVVLYSFYSRSGWETTAPSANPGPPHFCTALELSMVFRFLRILSHNM